MTVEIKELVIKATVTQNQARADANTPVKDEDKTHEIVSLCVAEVLRILKREKER